MVNGQRWIFDSRAEVIISSTVNDDTSRGLPAEFEEAVFPSAVISGSPKK
jgi:hypothetical protein